MDLSFYKWKNRLLLVFASSTAEESYEEQLRLLEGPESEFEERDLLPGFFHEVGKLAGVSVPQEDVAKVRERFSIDPDGFVVLLVGKDGGEKFRAEEPVPAEEIFRRIDAMPMRRREMRERG